MMRIIITALNRLKNSKFLPSLHLPRDVRPVTYSVVKQHLQTNRFYTGNSDVKCELFPLGSRGLVRLSGNDAVPFLQGLVTNDVTVLGENCKALYSLMLNVQGRVLYDLVMYHTEKDSGEQQLYLECDKSISGELIKLMKKYKIRRKVDITDVTEEYKVFAVSTPDNSIMDSFPGNTSSLVTAQLDPRLNRFGWRIIAQDGDSLVSSFEDQNKVEVRDEEDYRKRRYIWGIGEGVDDLPPGNCFPLESNGVYLNGVCFHKGCYIGQELTARTHHTGVTRKRLMPLMFQKSPGIVPAGTNILTESGKSAGKFRSSVGTYGLGLMRIADIDKGLSVMNEAGDNISVTATKPDWWAVAESVNVDVAS